MQVHRTTSFVYARAERRGSIETHRCKPIGLRTSASMSYSPSKLPAAIDRITRYATGRSNYNNLEAPVSVLDGRKRSSSVGQAAQYHQYRTPIDTTPSHDHKPPPSAPHKAKAAIRSMRLPLASDSQFFKGQDRSSFEPPERGRLNTICCTRDGAPTAASPTLAAADRFGTLTSPTSPTAKSKTDANLAPMQTCTNTVIQSGPLQVFMFKQTNVTVLTQSPALDQNVNANTNTANAHAITNTKAKTKHSQLRPSATLNTMSSFESSFERKAHGGSVKVTPQNKSIKIGQKTDADNLNVRSGDGATGLSAIVQNLLRRISPANDERKLRLRRKTTTIVYNGREESKVEPVDVCSPNNLANATENGNSNVSASRPKSLQRCMTEGVAQPPLTKSSSKKEDASDSKTVPCKRKLVKSHITYGGSLDDTESPAETSKQMNEAAGIRSNRVMSCTVSSGVHSSKPTKSILERLRKAKGQASNCAEMNPHKQAVQTNSTNSSAMTDQSRSSNAKSQRSERVSTASTQKSRETFLSSKSSNRHVSSTGYSTTSITSDRISSEVSSGAIADIEESVTEESDIFASRYSPNRANSFAIGSGSVSGAQRSYSTNSHFGSAHRNNRFHFSVSTDRPEISSVAAPGECDALQSEKEKGKEKDKGSDLLPSDKPHNRQHRSPQSLAMSFNANHNDLILTDRHERGLRKPQSSAAPMQTPVSPQLHKVIKLSLTAFGYGLKPYSTHRALKSLNDLRSPAMSPLQSPTSCIKTSFCTSGNQYAIALLIASGKHELLKRFSSPLPLLPSKHKIRRTSSF